MIIPSRFHQLPGPGAPPEALKWLHGRENGVCYYASRTLASCPSAVWLLNAKDWAAVLSYFVFHITHSTADRSYTTRNLRDNNDVAKCEV